MSRISFEQAQPFDPYGSQVLLQQANINAARDQEARQRSLAITQQAAESAQRFALGSGQLSSDVSDRAERGRQFDVGLQAQAQRDQYIARQQAERDNFLAAQRQQEAVQDAELRDWLGSREMSNAEKVRMDRLNNQLASIASDPNLTKEQKKDLYLKAKFQLDPLEQRAKEAQARRIEAETQQTYELSARQTSIDNENAKLRAMSIADRVKQVPGIPGSFFEESPGKTKYIPPAKETTARPLTDEQIKDGAFAFADRNFPGQGPGPGKTPTREWTEKMQEAANALAMGLDPQTKQPRGGGTTAPTGTTVTPPGGGEPAPATAPTGGQAGPAPMVAKAWKPGQESKDNPVSLQALAGFERTKALIAQSTAPPEAKRQAAAVASALYNLIAENGGTPRSGPYADIAAGMNSEIDAVIAHAANQGRAGRFAGTKLFAKPK